MVAAVTLEIEPVRSLSETGQYPALIFTSLNLELLTSREIILKSGAAIISSGE